jgi:hypothetical protein
MSETRAYTLRAIEATRYRLCGLAQITHGTDHGQAVRRSRPVAQPPSAVCHGR